MKPLLTLLLIAFTGSVFANDITISFPRTDNYQVAIDGHPVFSNSAAYNNAVRLSNYSTGQHAIEVYRIERSRKWRQKNLVYRTSFLLRPWSDIFIDVDNDGRVRIDERRNGDRDRNDRDHDWNRNNRPDRNDNYDNRPPNYNRAVLNPTDFNNLVQHIEHAWFNKSKKAEDAINSHYFTTEQVSTLVQLFSSDHDKLDLAKQAYSHTVDKQNYYQLYDVFSNRRSRRELENYIKTYRY